MLTGPKDTSKNSSNTVQGTRGDRQSYSPQLLAILGYSSKKPLDSGYGETPPDCTPPRILQMQTEEYWRASHQTHNLLHYHTFAWGRIKSELIELIPHYNWSVLWYRDYGEPRLPSSHTKFDIPLGLERWHAKLWIYHKKIFKELRRWKPPLLPTRFHIPGERHHWPSDQLVDSFLLGREKTLFIQNDWSLSEFTERAFLNCHQTKRSNTRVW